jgi:hypothetical protein
MNIPVSINYQTMSTGLTRSGLYVNCLALQAVVDRWTTITNEPSNRPSGPSGTGSSLRVLMELYRVNETYIQEVVDASRKILQTVLDGLLPGEHLKHCPVRTYFRILSGMIFILKVGPVLSRFSFLLTSSMLTFDIDLHAGCNRGRCARITRPAG